MKKYEINFSKYVGEYPMCQDVWKWETIEVKSLLQAKKLLMEKHNIGNKRINYFISSRVLN